MSTWNRNGIVIAALVPVRDAARRVDHYDQTFRLGFTAEEKGDLVQYLKSL